ncbi:MAG: hypothetical protein WC489_09070 [Patescibacteria group bacterium]
MIDCKKCFHYYELLILKAIHKPSTDANACFNCARRPGLKDHYEPRPTAHEGREDPIKQLDML